MLIATIGHLITHINVGLTAMARLTKALEVLHLVIARIVVNVIYIGGWLSNAYPCAMLT